MVDGLVGAYNIQFLMMWMVILVWVLVLLFIVIVIGMRLSMFSLMLNMIYLMLLMRVFNIHWYLDFVRMIPLMLVMMMLNQPMIVLYLFLTHNKKYNATLSLCINNAFPGNYLYPRHASTHSYFHAPSFDIIIKCTEHTGHNPI